MTTSRIQTSRIAQHDKPRSLTSTAHKKEKKNPSSRGVFLVLLHSRHDRWESRRWRLIVSSILIVLILHDRLRRFAAARHHQSARLQIPMQKFTVGIGFVQNLPNLEHPHRPNHVACNFKIVFQLRNAGTKSRCFRFQSQDWVSLPWLSASIPHGT